MIFLKTVDILTKSVMRLAAILTWKSKSVEQMIDVPVINSGLKLILFCVKKDVNEDLEFKQTVLFLNQESNDRLLDSRSQAPARTIPVIFKRQSPI